MKARNYCFTYNIPVAPDGTQPFIPLPFDEWHGVSYLIYQLERAPATDRLHLQGYLELEGQQRLSFVRNLDGLAGAHWETRRGTQAQAREYCQKEESRVSGPYEHGTPKSQGKRNDLDAIRVRLRDGESDLAIAETHFGSWCRYGKSFKEYARRTSAKRDFKSTVILIVGPAGVGKSRFAHILLSFLGSHYKLPDKHSGFWCDDYNREDTFFIDEMDGDRMRPKVFNELCDRYECVLPAHGGVGHQLLSRYILIVSNYLPKFWWRKRNPGQLEQTHRRIDMFIPLFKDPSLTACRCPNLCAIHHS